MQNPSEYLHENFSDDNKYLYDAPKELKDFLVEFSVLSQFNCAYYVGNTRTQELQQLENKLYKILSKYDLGGRIVTEEFFDAYGCDRWLEVESFNSVVNSGMKRTHIYSIDKKIDLGPYRGNTFVDRHQWFKYKYVVSTNPRMQIWLNDEVGGISGNVVELAQWRDQIIVKDVSD